MKKSYKGNNVQTAARVGINAIVAFILALLNPFFLRNTNSFFLSSVTLLEKNDT